MKKRKQHLDARFINILENQIHPHSDAFPKPDVFPPTTTLIPSHFLVCSRVKQGPRGEAFGRERGKFHGLFSQWLDIPSLYLSFASSSLRGIPHTLLELSTRRRKIWVIEAIRSLLVFLHIGDSDCVGSMVGMFASVRDDDNAFGWFSNFRLMLGYRMSRSAETHLSIYLSSSHQVS